VPATVVTGASPAASGVRDEQSPTTTFRLPGAASSEQFDNQNASSNSDDKADEALSKLSHWRPSSAALFGTMSRLVVVGVLLALVHHWWSVYGANYSQGMRRVPAPKQDDFEDMMVTPVLTPMVTPTKMATGKPEVADDVSLEDDGSGEESECADGLASLDAPLNHNHDHSLEHVRGASARAGMEYEPSVSGQSVSMLYAEAEALRNRSPTNTEAQHPLTGPVAYDPVQFGMPCCLNGAVGGAYAPTPQHAHCMPPVVCGPHGVEQMQGGTTVLRVEIAEVGGSLQVDCAGVSEAAEVQARVHQLGCAVLGPDFMPPVAAQVAILYVDLQGRWLALPPCGPQLFAALSGAAPRRGEPHVTRRTPDYFL